jgi:hypothetical protein
MPKSATQNLDVDGYNVKIQVNGLVATVIDAVVINEEYASYDSRIE